MREKIIIKPCKFCTSIKVLKSRVEVPESLNLKKVKYVIPTSPVILVTSLLVFIASAIFLTVLGLVAVGFLMVSIIVLYSLSRRWKEKEINVVKEKLPEEKVVFLVKKAIYVCTNCEEAETTFTVGNTEVLVKCGYPVKCVEYDKKSIFKFSIPYVAILTCLVVFYVLKLVVPLIAVSTVGLAVAIKQSKTRLCRKYLIRKILGS